MLPARAIDRSARIRASLRALALDGSKISVERDRNSAIYGPEATPEQILTGKAEPDPKLAQRLSALANTLARYSPPKRSATR